MREGEAPRWPVRSELVWRDVEPREVLDERALWAVEAALVALAGAGRLGVVGVDGATAAGANGSAGAGSAASPSAAFSKSLSMACNCGVSLAICDGSGSSPRAEREKTVVASTVSETKESIFIRRGGW